MRKIILSVFVLMFLITFVKASCPVGVYPCDTNLPNIIISSSGNGTVNNYYINGTFLTDQINNNLNTTANVTFNNIVLGNPLGYGMSLSWDGTNGIIIDGLGDVYPLSLGANINSFEMGNIPLNTLGAVSTGQLTINGAICNSTACFSLSELNNTGSSSSGSYNATYESYNTTYGKYWYNQTSTPFLTDQTDNNLNTTANDVHFNSSILGGDRAVTNAVLTINNSGNKFYTINMFGGTNPSMIMNSNNVTTKLQSLDIAYGQYGAFGTESNHDIDVLTNNQRRMAVTKSGAFVFGAYANPYAGVEFNLGNYGQASSTHLFRILDSTYNNIFVIKSGVIGMFNLNPTYPLDVGRNVSEVSIYSQASISGNKLLTRSNQICNATICWTLQDFNKSIETDTLQAVTNRNGNLTVNINSTANITANYFIGNGSLLTDISAPSCTSYIAGYVCTSLDTKMVCAAGSTTNETINGNVYALCTAWQSLDYCTAWEYRNYCIHP